MHASDVDYVIRFLIDAGSGPDRDIIYNDDRVWITYTRLNEWTLEILGIGTVEDLG